MIRIKLCGLRRDADVEAACVLLPEYVGFVFADSSRRCVTERQAEALHARLAPGIQAVGVFVDETPERVAALLRSGIIDIAQLHGHEDEAWISRLRKMTDRPLIQAFRVRSPEDVRRAEQSSADLILLDAGQGNGRTFAWDLAENVRRPWFLAGGLTPDNAAEAAERLRPWGMDVSSGIETDGWKDPEKMRAFVEAVRGLE